MRDNNLPDDERKKFDIQLAAALKHEGRLKELLEGATLELKTERHQYELTGNIAIEYENHGKPSGIAATQADYWVHELLDRQGDTKAWLMFERETLKEICRHRMRQGHSRQGGDYGASKMVLLDLRTLFLEELFK